MLLFVVGCTLAAATIGGLSFWQVNRAATAEAINDAETVTQIDAHGIVQHPLLTPALLAGSPAAIHALDTAVTEGVLCSSRVMQVKICSGPARSSLRTSTRSSVRRSSSETTRVRLSRVATPTPRSVISPGPENRFERSFSSLVEVYLPLKATNGTELLFETWLETALRGGPGARLELASFRR